MLHALVPQRMNAVPEPASPADPNPRDPRQPANFEPVVLGKALLREARSGALATLDAHGGPMASLVSIATDLDGTPITLVSGLSHHTRNLSSDQRFSLLLSRGGKGDPLAHPRLTLTGLAQPTEDPLLRRRFLARHPKAELYVDFPDFQFFRLNLDKMFLNGGFARAFDGPARHILCDMGDRAAFADLEASAIAHMNADHADALRLYAQVLCGKPDGAWRASGLDPEGLDLMLGDRTARLDFPEPVREPGGLRRMLADLAMKARAAQNGA